MAKVNAKTGAQNYKTVITGTSHTFLADEPADLGGKDLGPNPNEFLAASLASCITITVRMYADRKKWPLDEVEVSVEVDYKTEPGITRFKKDIILKGDLTEDQKLKLYIIAGKCPVNKALQQTIIME